MIPTYFTNREDLSSRRTAAAPHADLFTPGRLANCVWPKSAVKDRELSVQIRQREQGGQDGQDGQYGQTGQGEEVRTSFAPPHKLS